MSGRRSDRGTILPIVGSAVCLLLAACDAPEDSPIRHPVADRIVPADVERERVRADAPQDRGPEALATRRLASMLDEMEPVWRVGQLGEDSESEVLGNVQDAVFGSGGTNLFILDSRFNVVRVYDDSGELLQEVGGPGRGPGEFAVPIAIALTEAGELVVGDEIRQAHRFRRVEGSWEFVGSANLNVAPFDLCVIEDRLFVLGVTEGTPAMIHVFETSGDHVDSFGETYETDSPLVRQLLGEGRIVCSAAENRVYVGFTRTPEVRAYSTDGRLEWVSEIEGYRQMPIHERPDRSTQLGLPLLSDDGEMHMLHTVVKSPGGPLLLQLARYRKDDFEELRTYSWIDSYLIDPESGVGGYTGRDVPGFAALSERHALGFREDPFPQVILFSFTGPSSDSTPSGR